MSPGEDLRLQHQSLRGTDHQVGLSNRYFITVKSDIVNGYSLVLLVVNLNSKWTVRRDSIIFYNNNSGTFSKY